MTAAVLFDLDETLLDRTTSLKAFLAAQYGRFSSALGGVSLERWQNRFLELDQRGRVSKSLVYPALLAESGCDPSLASEMLSDYQRRCCEHALPFHGMQETLATLRRDGLKLGIITNGETAFQSRHIRALGLDVLVDVILISETEGLRKPEPMLFERAALRLRVSPADCLFVGDNPLADILGAHSAWMRTAWIARNCLWPIDAPPNPGPELRELQEVLDLVRTSP